MEPLRIGVLGAARINNLAIAQPARLTGHRLVAIAARDRSRGEEHARTHDVERVLDSYQAVIDDPEVEVVYNPLPNGLHGPWNLRAIAAGKHVLTEKPSASNAEEARAVRDAAKAAGVHVVEAFHYRYHPVMHRMIEIAGSGDLGEILEVEVHMGFPNTNPDDPRWSFELAGGSLMDVGCYALHALRSLGAVLGGAPTLASAAGGMRPTRPGVDEWLTATLEFPGGAAATMHSSFITAWMDFSLRLIGTRGEAIAQNFVLPHIDDRIVVTVDGHTRLHRMGRRISYAYELEAVAELIRNGIAVPTDADDAVLQAELIDACYLAAGMPLRPTSMIGA